MIARKHHLLNNLKQLKQALPMSHPVAEGQLVRVVGLTLEASGCRAPVGSLCAIDTMGGELIAEVIGFDEHLLYLMPIEELKGVLPGARVRPLGEQGGIAVGMSLLGRVLDGGGEPLDGLGPLGTTDVAPRHGPAINPLARRPIHEPLDVGIRAINAMLTVGKGQRMGLFAGSGVGKSVLLGMMTRGTTADVIVVGLVGDPKQRVAILAVSQDEIELVRIGQPVLFMIASHPRGSITGTVTELATSPMATESDKNLSPTSPTYQVRVRIDDKAVTLPVGLRGTASITVDRSSMIHRIARFLAGAFSQPLAW